MLGIRPLRALLAAALSAALSLGACSGDPLKDDSKTAIGSQKKCIGFGHVPHIQPYYSPCYSPFPPKTP
jgi:ABC-type oligopeptide transport system substrate-binding subunit